MKKKFKPSKRLTNLMEKYFVLKQEFKKGNYKLEADLFNIKFEIWEELFKC